MIFQADEAVCWTVFFYVAVVLYVSTTGNLNRIYNSH